MKEIMEKTKMKEYYPTNWRNPNVWKPTPIDSKKMILGDRLLCTFVREKDAVLQIRNIMERIDNLGSMMLLELNPKVPGYEYAITYNVTGYVDSLPYNTSMMHRRKDSKTMYTIDAVNRMESIDGFTIDWEKYRNSIVVEKWGLLQVYQTKVLKIFKSASYV